LGAALLLGDAMIPFAMSPVTPVKTFAPPPLLEIIHFETFLHISKQLVSLCIVNDTDALPY
jgi:hypothetical protein